VFAWLGITLLWFFFNRIIGTIGTIGNGTGDGPHKHNRIVHLLGTALFCGNALCFAQDNRVILRCPVACGARVNVAGAMKGILTLRLRKAF
jgi:hypothetical protein